MRGGELCGLARSCVEELGALVVGSISARALAGGDEGHMPLVIREGIVVGDIGPVARHPMEEVAGLAGAACPPTASPAGLWCINSPWASALRVLAADAPAAVPPL